MVLHELSHGYHHKFLPDGQQNMEIRSAYENAMQRGLYDSVLRISGQVQKAYATTNEKEYFAEISEAFFGTNDFYPFVRAELRRHDPVGFDMLHRLWGIGSAQTH
jgi:hypothetical protein